MVNSEIRIGHSEEKTLPEDENISLLLHGRARSYISRFDNKQGVPHPTRSAIGRRYSHLLLYHTQLSQ